tara:strand:- start:32 stop:151 length:120 start_codon:yes stop_codon:yes gene_type:complete
VLRSGDTQNARADIWKSEEALKKDWTPHHVVVFEEENGV